MSVAQISCSSRYEASTHFRRLSIFSSLAFWGKEGRSAGSLFFFEKPFLCAFSDNDPVTAGGQAEFLSRVPGTKGLPHTTIKGGGHFLQEMAPEQVSNVIVEFIRTT